MRFVLTHFDQIEPISPTAISIPDSSSNWRLPLTDRTYAKTPRHDHEEPDKVVPNQLKHDLIGVLRRSGSPIITKKDPENGPGSRKPQDPRNHETLGELDPCPWKSRTGINPAGIRNIRHPPVTLTASNNLDRPNQSTGEAMKIVRRTKASPPRAAAIPALIIIQLMLAVMILASGCNTGKSVGLTPPTSPRINNHS